MYDIKFRAFSNNGLEAFCYKDVDVIRISGFQIIFFITGVVVDMEANSVAIIFNAYVFNGKETAINDFIT